MNYTAEQVAEAKRIVAAAEAAERENVTRTARERQEKLALLIAQIKDNLNQIQTLKADAGWGFNVDLTELVDSINDVDTSNTFREESWYGSNC